MLRSAAVMCLIWNCLLGSTTGTAVNTTNNVKCGVRMCSNSTRNTQELMNPRSGGTSEVNLSITSRILGGGSTQNCEVPWVVAILTEEDVVGISKYVYYRAGSLINPRVVLTAAHPFSEVDADKLLVRAGEYSLHSTEENVAHQNSLVSYYVIHENYTKAAYLNDIALLFLKDQFQITETVNVICLSPPNQNYDFQKGCFMSGWGKDQFGESGRHQENLKTIDLPIVPRNECLIKLRKTFEEKIGPNFDFSLHDSIICAGGEVGKDSCEGDGGAPLVCPIPGTTGQYHQIGIVSWGIGCGGPIPGAYVNVAFFRSWIDEKLNR